MEENKRNVTVGGVDVTERGRDVVWPIFLIFVGVMLLLNTLSIIDWNIWGYLIRFWPILLILGGLRIVLGHSRIAEIGMSVVAILLFAGIGVYAYLVNSTEETVWIFPKDFVESVRESYTGIFDNVGDSLEKEITISNSKYEDVEKVDLGIQTAATTFTVTDENSENVLGINARYYENFGVPTLTEKFKDGDLDLQFTSLSETNILNWRNTSPTYDFVLGTEDIVYGLDIDLGAGKGEILLDNFPTSSVSADIGAGELDVEFGESSIPVDLVSFDIGAGDVTLTIPSDISFSLTYTVGVGEVELNDSAIVSFAGEGVYKSSNFGDVDTVLDIDVNVGAGAFHIVTK